METPEYTGLAIVALLADPNLMEKSGEVMQCSEVGQAWGYKDVDGTDIQPLIPPKAVDRMMANFRASRL